jgi:hypothetical protein
MKNVAIPEAQRLANETGATRLMILAVDDDGNYAFTTFGRTKLQCKRMAAWAELHAPDIALMMARGTD